MTAIRNLAKRYRSWVKQKFRNKSSISQIFKNTVEIFNWLDQAEEKTFGQVFGNTQVTQKQNDRKFKIMKTACRTSGVPLKIYYLLNCDFRRKSKKAQKIYFIKQYLKVSPNWKKYGHSST